MWGEWCGCMGESESDMGNGGGCCVRYVMELGCGGVVVVWVCVGGMVWVCVGGGCIEC